MKIFETKVSPKAFFTVNGKKYTAVNGRIVTDEKEIIDFLSKNPYWDDVTEKEKKENLKKVVDKESDKKKEEPVSSENEADDVTESDMENK